MDINTDPLLLIGYLIVMLGRFKKKKLTQVVTIFRGILNDTDVGDNRVEILAFDLKRRIAVVHLAGFGGEKSRDDRVGQYYTVFFLVLAREGIG